MSIFAIRHVLSMPPPSQLFAFLPADSTSVQDTTLPKLQAWTSQNNIRQSLDVAERWVYGNTNNPAEQEIIVELEGEVRVVRLLLDRIRTLSAFRASCWFLGHWRLGPLDGLMTDLIVALKLVQSKLGLLYLLRS